MWETGLKQFESPSRPMGTLGYYSEPMIGADGFEGTSDRGTASGYI